MAKNAKRCFDLCRDTLIDRLLGKHCLAWGMGNVVQEEMLCFEEVKTRERTLLTSLLRTLMLHCWGLISTTPMLIVGAIRMSQRWWCGRHRCGGTRSSCATGSITDSSLLQDAALQSALVDRMVGREHWTESWLCVEC